MTGRRISSLVTLAVLAAATTLNAQVTRDHQPDHADQIRGPLTWDGELRPNGKGWGEAAVHTSSGTTAASGANGISYHGGPVMLGTTNVYVIWYGNWSSRASAQTILLNELSYIGGTRYFNTNTTYYNGNWQRVSNSIHYAGSTHDNYSQGTNLNDSSVTAIVSRALSLGLLPKDSRGVYFVLTSEDVHETTGFCTSYCGWHWHQPISGYDIKFAFVGDPTTQCLSTCAEQSTRSPNGDPGADAMASVIAHELSESVSDPDQNAWYDASGWENADKCAWNFGTTYTASNGSKYNVTWGGREYLIQRNWVNASGGYCGISY